MANITTYLKNQLLNHSVGEASFSMPTTLYAGLFVTAPTEAYTSAVPTGTEIASTSNGYARIPLTNANWNAAANGSISNSTDIRWPASGNASGYWNITNSPNASGSITYVGLFDASLNNGQPAGNLLWFGPLSATVLIGNGDNFTIGSGSLVLTFT